MGVSLALQKLDAAIKENRHSGHNQRICTLGPIIHNPQVIGAYADQGVICLQDIGQIAAEDHVLIRAHGIPFQEEEIVAQKAAMISDATCPKVKKAQLAIQRQTDATTPLLLFGEPDHPEVRGLVSYSGGQAIVFQTLSDLLKNLPSTGAGYVLASQTTQDKQIFEEIAIRLASLLPNLVVLDTICDATRMRQEETLEIAAEVDCMIIVGGKSSGNTRRLASIAQDAGIPVFHIETEKELKKELLGGYQTVGLSAGASTPLFLIDEIEKWLLNL